MPSGPAGWTPRAGIWRRARGVVPLAAPLVFGALTEVEERTMALEARAFTAPGRQTLLRVPPRSGRRSGAALGWRCWPWSRSWRLRLAGRLG